MRHPIVDHNILRDILTAQRMILNHMISATVLKPWKVIATCALMDRVNVKQAKQNYLDNEKTRLFEKHRSKKHKALFFHHWFLELSLQTLSNYIFIKLQYSGIPRKG